MSLEPLVLLQQEDLLQCRLLRGGPQLPLGLIKGKPCAQLLAHSSGGLRSTVLDGLVCHLVRSLVLLQQALETGAFVTAFARQVLL